MPQFVKSLPSTRLIECSFRRFLSSPVQQSSLFGLFSPNVSYVNKSNKWHIDKETNGSLEITNCCFFDCASKFGGALQVELSDVTIVRSRFIKCFAKNGGAMMIQISPVITLTDCLFVGCEAKRFGAAYFDGCNESCRLQIDGCNFTMNKAREWIGGVRIQQNEGMIQGCVFHGTRAKDFGALWDYSHQPGYRKLRYLAFLNNSVETQGAGFTVYHLHFDGQIEDSVFVDNSNGEGESGTAIYLHSDKDELKVRNCAFDQQKDTAILVYFPDTSRVIEHQNQYESTNKNEFQPISMSGCSA